MTVKEHLDCVLIDEGNLTIFVMGNRGSQRGLQFSNPFVFREAVVYCQHRILPQDIHYIM